MIDARSELDDLDDMVNLPSPRNMMRPRKYATIEEARAAKTRSRRIHRKTIIGRQQRAEEVLRRQARLRERLALKSE